MRGCISSVTRPLLKNADMTDASVTTSPLLPDSSVFATAFSEKARAID